MDLTPARTAVIAVHPQHDIVATDGAFGGFFAAQAAERDVIGQAGQLLEAARWSGATAVYTRVAWQPGYTDLVANSPLLGMVAQFGALVEGSGKAEIVRYHSRARSPSKRSPATAGRRPARNTSSSRAAPPSPAIARRRGGPGPPR